MITTSGSDNYSASSVVEEPKLPVMADSKGRVRVTKEQRREILALRIARIADCPLANRQGVC